jgi:histidine triad (HIT) family protein
MNQACIFCQICNEEVPSHKIWEDDKYLAFLSIYPNTEGITVVVPKGHLTSYLFDQVDSDIMGIMMAAKLVSRILVEKLNDVARVGIVFEGYGVDHLHAKLFPLHGTKGEWKAIRSNINAKYALYPGYISTHDVERESDETLSMLAERLKK